MMTDVKNKTKNLRFCFDKDIDTDSLTGRVKNIRLDERDNMFTVDMEIINKGV